MQAFLFLNFPQSLLEEKLTEFKKEMKISPFNFHFLSPSPSIGIAEVKELLAEINRKPYGGGKRLFFLQAIEKATLPAQNALLKILEEPPPENFFFLSSQNAGKILPTILSRCQIIKAENLSQKKEKTHSQKPQEILRKILSASPGKRIILAQELAENREKTEEIITGLASFLSQNLFQKPKNFPLSFSEIATLLSKLSAGKNLLTQNVNYKMTLEILFLAFPSSSSVEKA